MCRTTDKSSDDDDGYDDDEQPFAQRVKNRMFSPADIEKPKFMVLAMDGIGRAYVRARQKSRQQSAELLPAATIGIVLGLQMGVPGGDLDREVGMQGVRLGLGSHLRGMVLWGVLWPLALICLGLTEIKCALVALGKWVSPGPRPTRLPIEHVFVLYLENRSFDHMLGFSGIRAAVDVNGHPTPFNEGFIPNSVTNNFNPYEQPAQAVSTSSPAEWYLYHTDLDPGHEFWPTLTALCGDNAHLYDKTTGAYPPIDNSGFVLNYSQRTRKIGWEIRLRECWIQRA
jgi:phospholipase C